MSSSHNFNTSSLWKIFNKNRSFQRHPKFQYFSYIFNDKKNNLITENNNFKTVSIRQKKKKKNNSTIEYDSNRSKHTISKRISHSTHTPKNNSETIKRPKINARIQIIDLKPPRMHTSNRTSNNSVSRLEMSKFAWRLSQSRVALSHRRPRRAGSSRFRVKNVAVYRIIILLHKFA